MIAKSLLLSLGNLLSNTLLISMSGDGKVTIDFDIKPAIVTGAVDVEEGTVVARTITVGANGNEVSWDEGAETLVYTWKLPGSDSLPEHSPPTEGSTGLVIGSKYFIPYSAGGFDDAPSDGKMYARKDGAWVEVPAQDTGTTAYLTSIAEATESDRKEVSAMVVTARNVSARLDAIIGEEL